MILPIVIACLGLLYIAWVLTKRRDLFRCSRIILKYGPICLKEQIRLWRGQYTQREKEAMENWYIGLPESSKPSPPWFEVKYAFLETGEVFLTPYHNAKFWGGNLIHYLPVIYNDCWWDSHFLLRVIERKVRRDAKAYAIGGHLESSIDTGNQLLELANICRRMLDEDYCKEEWKAHDKKWGPLIDQSEGPNAWHMGRERACNKQLEEQECDESDDLFKLEERRHNADVKRMSELFLNIRSWWD